MTHKDQENSVIRCNTGSCHSPLTRAFVCDVHSQGPIASSSVLCEVHGEMSGQESWEVIQCLAVKTDSSDQKDSMKSRLRGLHSVEGAYQWGQGAHITLPFLSQVTLKTTRSHYSIRLLNE